MCVVLFVTTQTRPPQPLGANPERPIRSVLHRSPRQLPRHGCPRRPPGRSWLRGFGKALPERPGSERGSGGTGASPPPPLSPAAAARRSPWLFAMHSLAQEIQSFSRSNLRKQCTRVTTLSGKRILETWRDARVQVVEVAQGPDGDACGYVQDLSLDLHVGVVKPRLLVGSQDTAHDLDTMKKYGVTHVLNVAYGVENAFPHDFTYKMIPILDLPETDIISYFPECFEFIEEAQSKDGVVLVHCNAGVSRAAAIVIGFLMHSEGLSFSRAFSLVKNARPAICPNPGFMEQLHKYHRCSNKNGNLNDAE